MTSYGDGICCSYGTGSYSLTAGGDELASGGEFEFSESTAISLAAGGGAACEQVAASRTGEVTWSSSDNCDADVEVSYTYSDVAVADCSSGDSADEGGYTITRTFTVTSVDNCGNETVMSCDQIITFTDTEAPVMSYDAAELYPASIACADMGDPFDPSFMPVTATDNCDMTSPSRWSMPTSPRVPAPVLGSVTGWPTTTVATCLR